MARALAYVARAMCGRILLCMLQKWLRIVVYDHERHLGTRATIYVVIVQARVRVSPKECAHVLGALQVRGDVHLKRRPLRRQNGASKKVGVYEEMKCASKTETGFRA
eukprot:4763065-Pleurochrysis_carterae.AAC.5